MNYLLSNGNTTTSLVHYIKDVVSLELQVPVNSIPYYSYGTESFIGEIRTSDIEVRIINLFEGIISEIKKNNSVKLSLDSVSIVNNIIKIELSINNITETLSITI